MSRDSPTANTNGVTVTSSTMCCPSTPPSAISSVLIAPSAISLVVIERRSMSLVPTFSHSLLAANELVGIAIRPTRIIYSTSAKTNGGLSRRLF